MPPASWTAPVVDVVLRPNSDRTRPPTRPITRAAATSEPSAIPRRRTEIMAGNPLAWSGLRTIPVRAAVGAQIVPSGPPKDRDPLADGEHVSRELREPLH